MWRKINNLLQWFLISLGVIVFIAGAAPEYSEEVSWVPVLLMSIGPSFIAAGISTLIASYYLAETAAAKRVVEDWGLKAIYETKSDMNPVANECLDRCKDSIDLIAMDMKHYLQVKKKVLEEKIRAGVKVRIIMCEPNGPMIRQRAIDEKQYKNDDEPSGEMSQCIEEVCIWVAQLRKKYPNCDVCLKYHDSYPAFSYLRIDKRVFFGCNLYTLSSQYNVSLEYDSRGCGYSYYNEYFQKLWGGDFVREATLSPKRAPAAR